MGASVRVTLNSRAHKRKRVGQKKLRVLVRCSLLTHACAWVSSRRYRRVLGGMGRRAWSDSPTNR